MSAAASPGPASAPSAARVLEALRGFGVGWVVGIPDNGSAALFEALETARDVNLITATREGEAVATACGLWLGGQSAVVAIQNTGLLESGDSLRGVAIRMAVPLLLLIGYRGYATLPDRSTNADAAQADVLVRPDVDSVAVLTEPTLRAWSIPYRELDADLAALHEMWDRAQTEARPTAVVLTGALSAVGS